MRTNILLKMLAATLILALSMTVGSSTWAQARGDRKGQRSRPISRRHQLAPGVAIEPGSVAFFSDLHMTYGKANRKADSVARNNMIAIANMFRTTPQVSEVVFGGDYYQAPNLNGLTPKQRSAALVRGLAGFQKRLGQKPLHVVFGNHDVPLKQPGGFPNGYEPVKAMADSLKKKQIDVIGTDWKGSYGFRLRDGAKIHIGHAPNASSGAIARAMRKMRFSTQDHTDRARAKMTSQPRPKRGEYVSGDSHVMAYSRGKATVVNLGTAGSGSRPVGDPFVVAIRQPTRGWLFLKPTPNGFVPHNPRGSSGRRRHKTRRGRAFVR
jgi:hypothetical protein